MKKEQAVLEGSPPASGRVNGHENQAEALEQSIETERVPAQERMRIVKFAWRRWLRFAEILGTIQMTVILSLIYWVMLPIIAVPFKLFADPLTLKSQARAGWVERHSGSQTLDEMKKQY